MQMLCIHEYCSYRSTLLLTFQSHAYLMPDFFSLTSCDKINTQVRLAAQRNKQVSKSQITSTVWVVTDRNMYQCMHICSPVCHKSWIASSELIGKPDESMTGAYQ